MTLKVYWNPILISAPHSAGRFDAETDERETGGFEDGPTELQGGHNEDGGEAVGDEVAEQDDPVIAPIERAAIAYWLAFAESITLASGGHSQGC